MPRSLVEYNAFYVGRVAGFGMASAPLPLPPVFNVAELSGFESFPPLLPTYDASLEVRVHTRPPVITLYSFQDPQRASDRPLVSVSFANVKDPLTQGRSLHFDQFLRVDLDAIRWTPKSYTTIPLIIEEI